MTSGGGQPTESRGGAVVGAAQTPASAHSFTVGAVGFGPHWDAEDSMAASIIRLEQENEELRAEVALLREEQRILHGTIEGLRDALCEYKCRDKAAADGGWGNI